MKQCPTPDKKRYATRQAAEARDAHAEIVLGHHLYPYACSSCGWWHLTKNPGVWLPTGSVAHPADIARIQGLNADEFTALVTADTKTQAPRADRIALRHRDNLTRWRWTLRTLLADIDQQLRTRATNTSTHNLDWLPRARSYRDTLNARLTECQALRRQANTRQETAA